MALTQTIQNNILTNVDSIIQLYTPKFTQVPYFAIMDVERFGQSTNKSIDLLTIVLPKLQETTTNLIDNQLLNYKIGDSLYKRLAKDGNIKHYSTEVEVDPDILMPRDYAKRTVGYAIPTKATIHSKNNLITNAEVFISSTILNRFKEFSKKSRQITLQLLSRYMHKDVNLLEVNIKRVAIELEVTNTNLLNALHSMVNENFMIPIDNPNSIRMNAKHTYRFIVDPEVAIHKPSNYPIINYTYQFMSRVSNVHNDTISLGVVKEHLTQGVQMVKTLRKLNRKDAEIERLKYQIDAIERLGGTAPVPNGLEKNKELAIESVLLDNQQ